MTPTAAQIVADAEWLSHRYDEHKDAFHYRHVPRARHAAIPFATDDYLGDGERLAVIGREEASALLGEQAPLNFIFHSAFCASTMLVRALDLPGSAMGISEPVILNDMTGWRRRRGDARRQRIVLNDVLAQLARPFEDGESVVLKPSTIFNGLAITALDLRTEARALLVHAPIEQFLLSVARKGLWGRLWVRELLQGLLQDGLVDLGFEPHDYFRQSDLQIAGICWLAEHKLFHRITEEIGPARVATLDSDLLTREPAETIARVAGHFGLANGGRAQFEEHPAIFRNSKSGHYFSAGERQVDQERARAAHGDEVAMVLAWVRAVAKRQGVSEALPHPLA